ncbi:MAG: TlyA family rRNA (cytidine-2'-O)-methyltransferase, partial [Clostridia bacterium]|nr:TlyA family rRNA (cytidine-2'-O)-methyltransferase [Clostridia bacterium]
MLWLMRLDVYLSDSGLCSSRTDAKSFIVGGAVTVNGRVVTKPSLSVEDGDSVKVNTDFKRFVSRGGIKLDAALLEFGVSVEGKRCIDVGASSGGFTDCLLQHGAREVIAVD